jgi:hypothetical protein
MFRTCVQRFDVTENLLFFCKIFWISTGPRSLFVFRPPCFSFSWSAFSFLGLGPTTRAAWHGGRAPRHPAVEFKLKQLSQTNRKFPLPFLCLTFFYENGIGFKKKFTIENKIRVCEHTKMDKHGRRAKKN